MQRTLLIRISAAVILVIVIFAAGLPFAAVWDGSFSLKIQVQGGNGIEDRDLRFAICRSEEEAEYAMKYGDDGEIPFTSKPLEADHYLLSIPCSGRTAVFEIETSYNEPKYIVAQLKGQDGELRRIKFAMPKGRGARTLQVKLP